ncbi:hypothetical protein [Bacillus sp. AK031]
MRKTYSLLLIALLLLLAACSDINAEEVNEVKLNYWGDRDFEAEFIESEKGVQAFVEARNTAEELQEGRVIKTEPILFYTLMMEKQEDQEYHLWFTNEDEGYIQSLVAGNSVTYQLDEQSVNELKKFLGEEDGLEKIEFE